MAAPDYRASVKDYQQAIAALYAPVRGLVERGAGDIAKTSDLEQKADAVIDCSQAFHVAARQGQASANPEERELAELHLLAGAAMDLHVASDLVRRSDDAPGDVVERDAALPVAMAELQGILDTLPQQGMRALIAADVDRAAAPQGREAAQAALRTAASDALTDIRDAAASVGQKALGNLVGLGAPQLKEAANVVLSEVISKVSQGVSWVIQKAVALVAKAVAKILDVLGKDLQDSAREKAAEWIGELQKGALFGTLLDRLYERARISQEIDQQIAGAPGTVPASRFNDASKAVAELASKFGKQAKTINWVLQGLSWARAWIMTLVPWGPIALPSAYLLTIACIVYLSGDYVDWFRTGTSERLDFVPGLRVTVRRNLVPA